jgi:hypothetical protein
MHRSTICSTVKPCAIMIASVQPSRQEASKFGPQPAVGLGAVATAAGLGHGVGGRLLNWGREDTTRPGAKAAVAAACALFRRVSQLRDAGPILDSPPGCHFGVLALPRGTLKIDERPGPPLSNSGPGLTDATP